MTRVLHLKMTFPLSGAEAQRALVLVLLLLVNELGFHWTNILHLNSFTDIYFPELLLEVLWFCFLIAPQPQCECSVRTERTRNKGWGRQRKYQLGSWSSWRITVPPEELEAAWSLTVRQPQPGLSLGSVQGNFSQRHQATAGSKAGVGILWI